MAGNGWETTLVILNTAATPVVYNLILLKPDGTASAHAMRTDAAAASVTASGAHSVLMPMSTASVTLIDEGVTLQEGWALLSADGNQPSIRGYGVIRHRAPGGGFSFETTVPLSNMQDYMVYMPFDNTAGFRTQLTLLNPSVNLPARALLTYRNPQGQVLLIDSVSLQPGQQMTLSLPDTYPDLANKTGTLNVETDIDIFSVVGLRFNDAFGVVTFIPATN
jgi:hypothetical protein